MISLKAIRGGKGSVSQTSVRQALVHRLMHGPAMSDADHKVAKMLTAEATED